jgi:hypothetical protein
LGISTPIASLLMIVLIVEAVAFQTSMVAVNRDWQQDIAASNDYARQRFAEVLVISNATISGADLTLNLTNIGSIVAYVDHVWVIGITDTTIHESVTLSSLVSVPPGAMVSYILDPSPGILDPANEYDFKAVTTRGNVAQIRYPLTSAFSTGMGTTVSTTISTTTETTISTTISTTTSITTGTTISTTMYTTTSMTTSTTISTTITTGGGLPDMISGALMIAYQARDAQGYNSGPTDSCHQEPPLTLTGISGLQTGTTLYFLNPWLINAVLTSADNSHTTMYYLVNATNTKSTPIVATAGTVDLTWYGSNHITGPLLGLYYQGQFYTPASSPTIAPGNQFYAIFKIDRIDLSSFPGNVFFIGSAAITNNVKGTTYYSAQLAIDGLWVRSSC